ncbi:Zn-ribbon domain-containing OB-fold protein [Tateyamaria sp.]|uniref:Zn-ribbon domain-containing OB-fold protein n=1 Tax=Tateyamaria sp. TaxID=1929288 RepID=UPI0032A0359A
MKRLVNLNYTLGAGWLTPWLDGLRNGKAVASTCTACDAAHFPPLRACPTCRQNTDGWCTLNGTAKVLFRTNGTDGDIAMVQFDGASSACIARADTLPEGTTRCALTTSTDNPPTPTLKAEPTP